MAFLARRRPTAVAGLLVLAGVLGGWVLWRGQRGGEGPRRSEVIAPRAERKRPRRDVALDSPFRNVRAGVEYVGDAACARCHGEIAESFAAHPMGRSLTPVSGATGDGLVGAPATGSFEADGFRYAVEHRDGRVFHKESRLDPRGRVLAEIEAEIRYVLGSGARGASYLVDRDGYLFQSPIAWYTQARRWDLSPGYRATSAHFERAVQVECVFCHANRVEAVKGPINRYRPPLFHGHAIGCERCHGPGGLHARQRAPSDAGDLTIVNPGRLEPSLREAVCEQCHLLGDHRIERAGREPFDFRPGLPLHEFIAVFFKPSRLSNRNKAIGHVEQMHASRCYRASGGRLGCISCHDPHRLPGAGERVSYYRGRCLECHADHGCGLPESARRAEGREDSCIRCHMPRSASSDIAHTASTNHRILRIAGEVGGDADSPSGDPAGLPSDDEPLVLFHRDLIGAEGRASTGRDLGIALTYEGRATDDELGRAVLGRMALPLLSTALKVRPDDALAWHARASALWLLNRREEAMADFQTVLKMAPDREETLDSAASLAQVMGRPEQALTLWERAGRVNPWRSVFHQNRAQVLMEGREWPRAIAECLEALRLNPALTDTRMILIECYLRTNDRPRAEAEFAILLALTPTGQRDQLLRWFEVVR
jgi:hypothetical protein